MTAFDKNEQGERRAAPLALPFKLLFPAGFTAQADEIIRENGNICPVFVKKKERQAAPLSRQTFGLSLNAAHHGEKSAAYRAYGSEIAAYAEVYSGGAADQVFKPFDHAA